VGGLEDKLFHTPAEEAARALYQARADAYGEKIRRLPASLGEERQRLTEEINRLKAGNASMREVVALERARRDLPPTPEGARAQWSADQQAALDQARVPQRHAQAFPGGTSAESWSVRLNFLSLMFCLMVGTAALPHVLMRYYTTPSVREARDSVAWSLFFILLLYLTAPAYAVFAKYEIYAHVINMPIAHLPSWVSAWGKVGLIQIEDINHDGLLQLAELSLNPDVIVLATPEIAGLPYVVSGLVAAGGLAAALSTADGLLLTITNALSHDIYYKIVRPHASTQWRLVVSKSLLLVVAILAATMASLRPASILYMVAWAFSLAGAAFFPALVLGIFWKRANRAGALAGMMVGLGVTLYYMLRVNFAGIPWLGLQSMGMEPWFGIQSTAAGVWGIPAGFLTIVVVSLLTKAPDPATQALVDDVRFPRLR